MKKKKKINFSEKIFIAGANGMAGSAIRKILTNNNYGKKTFRRKNINP